MMRALIVDDEPLARSNVAMLLARDPSVRVVGECGSAEEALAALPALRPDLVFLDVEMPECDGFELLERIGPAPPFAIVFVTAHHQFALRAFDVGALDYLLKPFDDARFDRVLERAKERLRVPGETQRFIVRHGSSLEVVKFADIDWIEASDYYSTLHVGSRAHMLRRSLADLEAALAPHGFQRIHRSAIVNLSRVRALDLQADGEYDVVLESGQRLRMSRRYRKAMVERLAGP
ncbi:LytTR family two component transcriptional regulator [Pseudoduganella flava]|uniref:LytTR family two component transcriptional regulator n=1 Tax=Pseudoduganella flava TaxID=871742 RepID=A0A562PNQ0_9BURK|nr:LytTR family DNA-binding domain-containing protein [Pseudoduganella flava]QGZ40396.1 response regulator [Pseudoduganella flava]TWI45830.1 LytTR family two component transcriptional regulator [Pseudoduganella flava]